MAGYLHTGNFGSLSWKHYGMASVQDNLCGEYSQGSQDEFDWKIVVQISFNRFIRGSMARIAESIPQI